MQTIVLYIFGYKSTREVASCAELKTSNFGGSGGGGGGGGGGSGGGGSGGGGGRRLSPSEEIIRLQEIERQMRGKNARQLNPPRDTSVRDERDELLKYISSKCSNKNMDLGSAQEWKYMTLQQLQTIVILLDDNTVQYLKDATIVNNGQRCHLLKTLYEYAKNPKAHRLTGILKSSKPQRQNIINAYNSYIGDDRSGGEERDSVAISDDGNGGGETVPMATSDDENGGGEIDSAMSDGESDMQTDTNPPAEAIMSVPMEVELVDEHGQTIPMEVADIFMSETRKVLNVEWELTDVKTGKRRRLDPDRSSDGNVDDDGDGGDGDPSPNPDGEIKLIENEGDLAHLLKAEETQILNTIKNLYEEVKAKATISTEKPPHPVRHSWFALLFHDNYCRHQTNNNDTEQILSRALQVQVQFVNIEPTKVFKVFFQAFYETFTLKRAEDCTSSFLCSFCFVFTHLAIFKIFPPCPKHTALSAPLHPNISSRPSPSIPCPSPG